MLDKLNLKVETAAIISIMIIMLVALSAYTSATLWKHLATLHLPKLFKA